MSAPQTGARMGGTGNLRQLCVNGVNPAFGLSLAQCQCEAVAPKLKNGVSTKTVDNLK
ncbi:hypothetical protein AB7W97_20515 [Providencia rettgeri]|uniref:hypothetical protein n=1 Tax=Providencia sp. PROV157 TaxID=2949867 RepID=UPI00234B1A0C|nr:hypothetical protein [Providencia sp. PROV157]